MDFFRAVTLGVVQGLTEFLPISSSGHLVLFQSLLGLEEPELLFDIAVHVGTLVAVCLFYFPDLKDIARVVFSRSVWNHKGEGFGKRLVRIPQIRLLALIIVGTIPTVCLGLAFRPIADVLFSSTQIVGFMLLVTGLMLWLTRRTAQTGRDIGQLTMRDALYIGVMQGLAILPGISRSGSTIALGLLRGIDRETAARYSFLLSIPAILGALVLGCVGIPEATAHPHNVGLMIGGGLVAFAVGYAALRILVLMIQRGRFFIFAPYCWVLGSLCVIYSFVTG
jgi:undecaprenyl-diphosphatase